MKLILYGIIVSAYFFTAASEKALNRSSFVELCRYLILYPKDSCCYIGGFFVVLGSAYSQLDSQIIRLATDVSSARLSNSICLFTENPRSTLACPWERRRNILTYDHSLCVEELLAMVSNRSSSSLDVDTQKKFVCSEHRGTTVSSMY